MFELTYSWECLGCGLKWEEQKKVEERSTECPVCKGKIKQKYSKSRAVWKASLER